MHGGVDAEVFKRLMPADYSDEQLAEVARQKDALFCAKAREFGVPHIAGICEALQMAKERGMRCIAVTNAPRVRRTTPRPEPAPDGSAAAHAEARPCGARRRSRRPSWCSSSCGATARRAMSSRAWSSARSARGPSRTPTRI